jgi:hypothetical protein
MLWDRMQYYGIEWKEFVINEGQYLFIIYLWKAVDNDP